MNRRLLLAVVPLCLAVEASDDGTALPSAPTITLSEEDREALAPLGEGVVGRALPAVSFDPGTFFPLEESEWVYRVVHGKNAGSQRSRRLTLGKLGDASVWHWILDERQTVVLEPKPGELGIRNEIDHHHNLYSIFEPPETLLDAGLRPNDPRTRTIDVRVFRIGSPDKVKHRGVLVATDTYLGMHRLTTPAGRIDCALIRTTYEGQVGPGKIADVFYRFYAEGRGLVAAVVHETVSALVIYRENKEVSLVLVDGPRRPESTD